MVVGPNLFHQNLLAFTGEITTKWEPIRTLGVTTGMPCHIIIANNLFECYKCESVQLNNSTWLTLKQGHQTLIYDKAKMTPIFLQNLRFTYFTKVWMEMNRGKCFSFSIIRNLFITIKKNTYYIFDFFLSWWNKLFLLN